jgi:hypothetical protein
MEFLGRFYDSVYSNFAGRKMVRERERERERERYHSSAQADYHVLIYFKIVLTRPSDITPMYFVIYDTV